MSGSGGARRIALATHSAHKAAELRELLAGVGADLVSLAELGVTHDVPEDGDTFEANALAKARAYAALTGLPTIADDSGIEVDALGGAPGVRTRRYAGDHATDAENNGKLLVALGGLAPEERGARYVCVLAFVEPAADDHGEVITARGECRGRIANGPRGSNGFGYDPIFEPAPEPPGGRTLGEWSAEEKNRISHRGTAGRLMAGLLRDRLS